MRLPCTRNRSSCVSSCRLQVVTRHSLLSLVHSRRLAVPLDISKAICSPHRAHINQRDWTVSRFCKRQSAQSHHTRNVVKLHCGSLPEHSRYATRIKSSHRCDCASCVFAACGARARSPKCKSARHWDPVDHIEAAQAAATTFRFLYAVFRHARCIAV